MSLWFPKMQTTTAAPPLVEASTQRNFDEGAVDFNDFITESPDMVSTENEDSNENNLEKFNSIFKR